MNIKRIIVAKGLKSFISKNKVRNKFGEVLLKLSKKNIIPMDFILAKNHLETDNVTIDKIFDEENLRYIKLIRDTNTLKIIDDDFIIRLGENLEKIKRPKL